MAPAQDRGDVRTPLGATPPAPDQELERGASGTRVDGVPQGNQPGHHPHRDQDKPDGAAFLAKMRGRRQAEGAPAGGAAADPPAATPDVPAVPGRVEDEPDPAVPVPGEPGGAAPADLVADDDGADGRDLSDRAADLARRGTEEAAQLGRAAVEEGAELLKKGLDAVKKRR